MNKEEFVKELKNQGISINDDQLDMLDIYYNFLVKYNEKVNLTAITKEDEVYLKHFYDSIIILKFIDFNVVTSLIDVGTGAGFPGVVIKILFPNIKLTLLDSNNKKTIFLEELINLLKLKKVQIVNKRAEEYYKDHNNEYDICISRAVAYIDIISSLCLPFIKTTGKVILMKGNFESEKKVLDLHQKELQIENYLIKKYYLPYSNDERNLISIQKNEKYKAITNYNQILNRNKKWKI